MAKSSRRRKQDRVRIESRHAEEARRRDRAEAKRQADELFERATDTALAPAELAALIMGELADSTGTGLIAHMRLQQGAEPVTLAETARLLLAACPGAGRADTPSPGSLPPGVLAFAVVAAHANSDEEEEARHTETLLDLARAAGDEGLLKVAGDVLTWTRPDEAAEMTGRYLLDHPRDQQAYTIWWQVYGRADPELGLELRERSGLDNLDALVGLGDPSDPGFDQRLGERLGERVRRAWQEAGPRAKARYQAHTQMATEIMRRRDMPPWEAERLRRAEADKLVAERSIEVIHADQSGDGG
jgi:hypothetical protein